jgi:hypothetical protein
MFIWGDMAVRQSKSRLKWRISNDKHRTIPMLSRIAHHHQEKVALAQKDICLHERFCCLD